MKEKEIIAGCLEKDSKAYKALVDTYSAYLFAICKRYMIDQEKAKDCLQESLIQIIRKIHLYKEIGKFKSWMASVTVKKCLDELRKEKRHQSFELESIVEPSIEENVSRKLEKDDLMNFLKTIPQKYRIAINMFLVEGYSHKEIGDHLNITESSSRSLVSRARKMVTDAFDEDGNMKVAKFKNNVVEKKTRLRIIRS